MDGAVGAQRQAEEEPDQQFHYHEQEERDDIRHRMLDIRVPKPAFLSYF